VIERTSFDDNIQLELYDCSREDLANDFEDTPSLAESGLYRVVVTRAAGGAPYGAIIADYELGPSARDMPLMRRCASVAFAAAAPFIAAASPRFFGVRSCAQLARLALLPTAFERLDLTSWSCSRDPEVARACGLTFPRFLLRAPYRRGDGRASSLEYDESTAEHEHLCWGNASFAFATRLTESFARHRWCANIVGPRGGGLIEGLSQPSGGLAGPTEVRLTDRTEAILSQNGFVPLVGMDDGRACFFSAPSTQKPMAFGATPEARDAELNSILGTRLPYFFILCRIVHYLRVVYHDSRLAQAPRADVERELGAWISQFIADASVLGPEERRRRPLRKVELAVTEPERAGEGRSLHLRLRPHFKYMGYFFTLSITAALEPG